MTCWMGLTIKQYDNLLVFSNSWLHSRGFQQRETKQGNDFSKRKEFTSIHSWLKETSLDFKNLFREISAKYMMILNSCLGLKCAFSFVFWLLFVKALIGVTSLRQWRSKTKGSNLDQNGIFYLHIMLKKELDTSCKLVIRLLLLGFL